MVIKLFCSFVILFCFGAVLSACDSGSNESRAGKAEQLVEEEEKRRALQLAAQLEAQLEAQPREEESAEVVEITQNIGVCDRTEQVKQKILEITDKQTKCELVTLYELAAIHALDLETANISNLKTGDFEGFVSLRTLILSGNKLNSLPAGIFSGLGSLEWLSLSNNELSSLPEGVFSGLSSLQSLFLGKNKLSSLPAGIFSDLTLLSTLSLSENKLSSLPEGIFSNLVFLEDLYLSFNSFGESEKVSINRGVPERARVLF